MNSIAIWILRVQAQAAQQGSSESSPTDALKRGTRNECGLLKRMLKMIWIEMLLNIRVEDRTHYDDDHQPYHVIST